LPLSLSSSRTRSLTCMNYRLLHLACIVIVAVQLLMLAVGMFTVWSHRDWVVLVLNVQCVLWVSVPVHLILSLSSGLCVTSWTSFLWFSLSVLSDQYTNFSSNFLLTVWQLRLKTSCQFSGCPVYKINNSSAAFTDQLFFSSVDFMPVA